MWRWFFFNAASATVRQGRDISNFNSMGGRRNGRNEKNRGRSQRKYMCQTPDTSACPHLFTLASFQITIHFVLLYVKCDVFDIHDLAFLGPQNNNFFHSDIGAVMLCSVTGPSPANKDVYYRLLYHASVLYLIVVPYGSIAVPTIVVPVAFFLAAPAAFPWRYRRFP